MADFDLFYLPFRPALDANGIVVAGASLTFYISGTSTLYPVYADASLTTPLANPLTANAAGVWPAIYVDSDTTYRVVLKTAGGAILNEVDPYVAGVAGEGTPGKPGVGGNTFLTLASMKALDPIEFASAILADGDNAPVSYAYVSGNFTGKADEINVVALNGTPLATGALVRQGAQSVSYDARRNVKQRLELQAFVTDTRFAGGAIGDGTADDTPSFLACAVFCEATGATMRIPCGTYKLTDTIPIRQSFSVVGDGTWKTIINMVSATVKPVFDMNPGNNVVILGARVSDMQIRCNGGTAVCDAITLRSAPENSTIRQCQIDNVWILNCRRGLAMSGVIYRNFFTNITVQGTTDIGIYSDAGFVDVTYNTFAQIEVTNVANSAWAYYIRSSYSTFDTMTSDGVAYFSSPAGVIRNYTTETVQATTFPEAAGSAVVTINQVQMMDNYTIRGVDPAKRSVALRINGVSVVNAMRMVGPHPLNALLLDGGSSGVVNTLQVDSAINPIENSHTDTILNGWTFNNCQQVTRRSMGYSEGPWTPTFSGWTTPPTVNAGGTIYERVGNRVFATMLADGGVAPIGGGIGGLPVASSSMSTGVATFNTSNPAKRIANGGLGPSSTTISNFGSVDMAGTTWTMTVEYRA